MVMNVCLAFAAVLVAVGLVCLVVQPTAITIICAALDSLFFALTYHNWAAHRELMR